MKTKLASQSLLLLGMIISIVSQSFAQEAAPTFRQRISNILPQPSLPSWAKGPGFEAAKKWYRDGYSTKNFSTEEKRAFRRFKKKFAIGAIIAAILITIGGVRWHQVRKQRAAVEQQRQEAAEQQRQKKAEARTQERVKEIFNAGSEEKHDLSNDYSDETFFGNVLPEEWIPITNDSYFFNQVIKSKEPVRYLLYFHAPTIKYGTVRGNVLSFPAQIRKNVVDDDPAGTLKIIETTADGPYTYEAHFVNTRNATQKIPIYVHDGIIEVQLFGKIRTDQLYSRAKTNDRINYFAK